MPVPPEYSPAGGIVRLVEHFPVKPKAVLRASSFVKLSTGETARIAV